MQMKRKIKSVLLTVMLISLLQVLTSCVTTKIETQYVYPDVSFPIFPDPIDVKYNCSDDTVSMPLSYWLLITDYKVDVDAVKEYLELLKEAYQKENEDAGK